MQLYSGLPSCCLQRSVLRCWPGCFGGPHGWTHPGVACRRRAHGGGDLSQRIRIKTGDELEALADQFNDMAGRLQESNAGLEQKVEERTREVEEKSRQLEMAS